MAVTNSAAGHDIFEPGARQPFMLDKLYERLEMIGTPMDAPKNFKLYNAGDLPDSCYLIKEGWVISFEYTYTGRQNVFSHTGNHGPDSLLLLHGMILGHRVTLSFRTTTPSKLVRIRREDLLNEIASDAAFANGIIYILAAKCVEANERFRTDSNRPVPWKLCNLLLSLADKHGIDHDGKLLIKLKYSQQMMADYLHVNRTTVARIIKELTDSSLIERINGYYCIRSLDKLQRYMEQFDMYKIETGK